MTRARSFAARLTVALALLLAAYGAIVGALGWRVATGQEEETLQRVSHGLARHIVGHWPEVSAADRGAADRAARDAVLGMLMAVNPGVQVYVLDGAGRVESYLGEPGMVLEHQVDLAPIRAFLAGAPLPLRGTDPMGSGVPRIFSAAMFPLRPGESGPPGYLYIVLDGAAREAVADGAGAGGLREAAALGVALAAGLMLVLGVFVFRRLTLPLRRLAGEMRAYAARAAGAAAAEGTPPHASADEVQAIRAAFADMTASLAAQAEREHRQAHEHRETMASVAHDLRTPLTALHGHLEALAGLPPREEEVRRRVVAAALAQSDKVRHLSQQLFELAALQSSGGVLQRERFRLDELVTDAVQKFELTEAPPPVTLAGMAPGRLELDGDLHLVERALSNLIDNARRHAPGRTPVRVSLRREGTLAQVVIEDAGPGLPDEVLGRLESGASLRDPPLRRAGGGIGGLGLAIAQRVAELHGGSLRPLPAPGGGTRLCLALPLAD